MQNQENLRCLITGSRGFVAGETIKQLDEAGIEWIGYDLLDGYDIRDYQQLYEFIEKEKPNRILHLAAIARFAEADKNPKLVYETNEKGTENVAEIAKEFHIPVVYSSTGSVYMPINETPPITENFKVMGNSQYGCSKLIGEKFIQECSPHIILRYSHILGAEKRFHGLVGGFLDRIERGMKPVLYNGLQSNDFCYVKDIASANVKAVTAPWDAWNQVYNIGTGEELSAQDAGDIICDIFGWTGGIEKLKAREVDPLRFVYNTSKAEMMLGYKYKYNFKQALLDMKKILKYNDKK